MVGWLSSSTEWWAAPLLGFLWCFGLWLGWVKVLKGEQWVNEQWDRCNAQTAYILMMHVYLWGVCV